MTPEDLQRIEAGASVLPDVGDSFATSFYGTLFEMAPEARGLFPDDLEEQKSKLFAELAALVTMGLSMARGTDEVAEGEEPPFTRRAKALGKRHIDYGAAPAHYEVVGAALLSTLADYVPEWGPADEQAWTELYGIVAETMLAGAAA